MGVVMVVGVVVIDVAGVGVLRLLSLSNAEIPENVPKAVSRNARRYKVGNHGCCG